MEEPQAQPSPINTRQEPTAQVIPPKSFPWKILAIFTSLMSTILIGAVTYYLFSFRKSVPPPEINLSCQQDSDCILAIGARGCCGCPQVANRASIQNNSNMVEYQLGKQYHTSREECSLVDCAPCEPIQGATCSAGVCQPQYIPGSEPAASPTPDPTANWQTYSNKHFTFQYPLG